MNIGRTPVKHPQHCEACALQTVVCHWLRLCLAVLFLVAWGANDAAHATSTTLPVGGSNVAAEAATPTTDTDRTAFWPFTRPHRPPIYESQPHNVTPHPAVARIIVPEGDATAFGSGTLVDVREGYGLVVTNWHVVRDSRGVVKVEFPGGFRSHARPLKVDSNWDLAALVIWRPPIEPVKLATQPPRPGDLLTIHGYGRGQYRIATGRCTTYYAPRQNFPHEMVELDVEARQGDSGGPIFNHCGEMAGVLFGAGEGTTMGSYSPRVSNFLATLAPDIGQANDQALVAVADRPAPNVGPADHDYRNGANTLYPSSPWSPADAGINRVSNNKTPDERAKLAVAPANAATTESEALAWNDLAKSGWYDPIKSALALIGLVAIALQLVKVVR